MRVHIVISEQAVFCKTPNNNDNKKHKGPPTAIIKTERVHKRTFKATAKKNVRVGIGRRPEPSNTVVFCVYTRRKGSILLVLYPTNRGPNGRHDVSRSPFSDKYPLVVSPDTIFKHPSGWNVKKQEKERSFSGSHYAILATNQIVDVHFKSNTFLLGRARALRPFFATMEIQ